MLVLSLLVVAAPFLVVAGLVAFGSAQFVKAFLH